MLRTNIVLDEKLVNATMKETGCKTRRGLVDFALRELLRHKKAEKILTLKGNVQWSGNLSKMRSGRTCRAHGVALLLSTSAG